MKLKAYSYIRFSTPEQLKGDSLRRQLEASRKYAEDNDLELDESLRDLGVSAYKGANKSKGDLGKFYQLVESGKIPSGSILIVENLDRLSRENPLDAFVQFTNIINMGIKVVTLQDNQQYDRVKLTENPMLLMGSIMYMARAHDESLTKSKRLSSAWSQKRVKAINGERKLTAKNPAWLKLPDDKKSFEKIPEICQAIELIFRLKLSGKGPYIIERELNHDPNIWKPEKKGRNRTGGWRESYIKKILVSRAVIGEYTPHRKVDGKRVPEKTAIKNYFPPVIDEQLFYLVQNQIKENSLLNGRGGGRTGLVNNIFSNVLKCGFCGAPMHYIDKGKPPKGGIYLHCDVSRRKLHYERKDNRACTAKPIRYKEFEKVFFETLKRQTSKILDKIHPDQNQLQLEIIKIDSQITVNNVKIAEFDDRISNLVDTISRTHSPKTRDAFELSLRSIYDEKEKLEKEINAFQKEKDNLLSREEKVTKHLDRLAEIQQMLYPPNDTEQGVINRKLINLELRNMFDWIKVDPLKEKYEELKEIKPGVVQHMESKYIDNITYRLKGTDSHGMIFLIHNFDVEDAGFNSFSELMTEYKKREFKSLSYN